MFVHERGTGRHRCGCTSIVRWMPVLPADQARCVRSVDGCCTLTGMANEEQHTGRSPSYSLRAVKRTQKQLEAAQRKADAAMAAAKAEGWSFRDIAQAAECAHATVRTRLAKVEDEQKAKKSDA